MRSLPNVPRIRRCAIFCRWSNRVSSCAARPAAAARATSLRRIFSRATRRVNIHDVAPEIARLLRGTPHRPPGLRPYESAVPLVEHQQSIDLVAAIAALVGGEHVLEFGFLKELAGCAAGLEQGFPRKTGQIAAEPGFLGNGEALLGAMDDAGRQKRAQIALRRATPFPRKPGSA